MFVLRKEQFAVFQKIASSDFETRMSSHIKKCFAAQWEELGEAAVRDLIRYGIQRAASYGIRKQVDVCKYLDIMVVFGRDFDRDPKLPWASSILNDSKVPWPSVRVSELHRVAVAATFPEENLNGESQSS